MDDDGQFLIFPLTSANEAIRIFYQSLSLSLWEGNPQIFFLFFLLGIDKMSIVT